jgi:hypothetical protein
MGSLPCTRLVLALLVSVGCVSPFILAAQAPAGETAAQFYLRWRSTALNAKSADEIAAFWNADTLEQFNMETLPERSETLAMVKRAYGRQSDVKVVKETATPNGARLSLEALDPDGKPLVGSADVVKENGAWKITNAVEQWKPKVQWGSAGCSVGRMPSYFAIGPLGDAALTRA